MNGTDLLLLVNTGTPETPTYEVVGSQRDAEIGEETETIDISSKDSRNQRVLPGRFSGTISLEALYVPDDAAYLALRQANRDGELILVARQESGVVTETVEAKIDSISETFPDQDAATISVSLTIDGQWQAVGS
jgi:TP901-1 family phage major tail protein